MIRDTHTDMVINVSAFHEQRDLIRHMVTELESGRTGFAIKQDLSTLTAILGTLDEINDQNNLDDADDFSHLDEGPECPGCTNTDLCPDCEYPTD